MRSHSGPSGCPVVLQISDIKVKGYVLYRKYPTSDEMTKVDLKREGDKLVALLPNQPPAGKLEYKVELEKDGKQLIFKKSSRVLVRFKGDVPDFVLVLHILLIFIAMFFSNATGLLAAFKINSYKFWTIITFVTIVIAGLILGPIVQKYAFNEWWEGVPYGWDLTDNKTLIAILAWLLALLMIRKRYASVWIIIASLITVAIFTIPHSIYGSQLDQETGKIIQGNILPFLSIFIR